MLYDYKGFRHEYKYILTDAGLTAVQKRLQVLMKTDPHLSGRSYYNVRSIYFDDYDDSFLNDNINGVDRRIKWRIRIYDRNREYISLECKMRKSDLISKKACTIDVETFNRIIDKKAEISQQNAELLNVFIKETRTRILLPRVIVEYERTPFVCNAGNTRITIDRKIRSSSETDAFLADRELFARPVLPEGYDLMEVKFDGFLPDHIAHSIEDGNMRRETFSKYYLARKFGFNGGY